MRVMVDTNVLFSAILFPNGQAAKILYKRLTVHEIVIPSYVIGKLKYVIKKSVLQNPMPLICFKKTII